MCDRLEKVRLPIGTSIKYLLLRGEKEQFPPRTSALLASLPLMFKLTGRNTSWGENSPLLIDLSIELTKGVEGWG